MRGGLESGRPGPCPWWVISNTPAEDFPTSELGSIKTHVCLQNKALYSHQNSSLPTGLAENELTKLTSSSLRCLEPRSLAQHVTRTPKELEDYLVFGGGQSEPYSWTCIPKKHTSTPSISSKAKSALVRYGKDSDISPESTNLK